MNREGQQRRVEVAWSRIKALGGSAVLENDLVAVDLAGTAVTDDDLKFLRALPQVQWVILDGTAIGDAGLMHLIDLPSLELLSIIDTQIRPEALASYCCDHPSVQIRSEPSPSGTINPFTGELL